MLNLLCIIPNPLILWLLTRNDNSLQKRTTTMNSLDVHEALYPFLDDIIIQGKPHSIQYGLASSEQGIVERSLVMWVDASEHAFPPTKKANRLAVSPMKFLHPSLKLLREIVTFNGLPYGPRLTMEIEFIAIREAFRIACGLTDEYDYIFRLSKFPSWSKGWV